MNDCVIMHYMTNESERDAPMFHDQRNKKQDLLIDPDNHEVSNEFADLLVKHAKIHGQETHD